MDEVRPRREDMQSTELVDQIHPGNPDPSKIIFQCHQIAALIILMLKTSSTELAEPRKGVVKVGGDSKAGHDGDEFDESEMNNVEVDGGKVRDDEVGKKG